MKRDRLADDFGRAIECPLPNVIADDRDGRRADFVFVFAKNSAESRRQTDDLEKI